jgi:hypothetical protein
MKNIAIIGLGPTASEAPPSGDDWERWGLAVSSEWPTFDRTFEMHDDLNINPNRHLPGYQDRLKEIAAPLYMQQRVKSLPNSREYPHYDINQNVFEGVPSHCRHGSSIAYMLALAIHLDPTEIGLFGCALEGVDSAGKPYDDQRPNLAMLVGLAFGRYCIVTGPSMPSILRLEIEGERYGVKAA